MNPASSMGGLKILIVEDEKPAAQRLEKLVRTEWPDMELMAQPDSVEDAVLFFDSGQKPDLAFFDIQLADGISFSIFEKTTVHCPVIFTTAFDQYAIKAFKVNSIDYLLKPVDPVELKAAIGKFNTLRSVQTGPGIDYSELARAVRGEKTAIYKKRFLVKTAGRLAFVPVEEVAYFFSDEGETFLVTRNNDRFLFENTLEELEGILDVDAFFRISRKMIVSATSIARIEPHFSGRFALILTPAFEGEVMVSRQRGTEFRDWLDQ